MPKSEADSPEKAISQRAPGGSGIPTWAVASATIFVLLGGILLATRDSREAGSLISAMNAASLKVSDEEDGTSREYGQVTISSHKTEVAQILGKCNTNPELAMRVFGELVTEGKKPGRIMACRMAYSLLNDGGLNATQQDEVFKGLIAQMEEGQDDDLRRVAQFWFSELIVATPVDKKSDYEKLETPKGKKDEKFKVATAEIEINKKKVLGVRWASSDACVEWWKKHGADAKWDADLKRFVIPAPK